jgi:DNA-binding response OmpR family regulator
MAEPSRGGLTVLVADPDPVQQQQIMDCLRPRYRVIGARTLAETVEMITQYRPAILLLEVEMPDGDGKILIKQVRESPTLKNMVVCCVTRRAGIKDKIAGFQSGADDYVVKPVNLKTFMWRVVLLSRIRQLS